MSTCQRVKGVRGLSWAPSSPFANPMAADFDSDNSSPSRLTIYNPYDGGPTNTVTALHQHAKNCNAALHLRGNWWVYTAQQSDLNLYSDEPNSCWQEAQQLVLS